MTPEAQRIAIAEACGWKYWHDDYETMLLRPDEIWPTYPHWKERGMVAGKAENLPLVDISGLPDYLKDLNAAHEMEKHLGSIEKLSEYADQLDKVCVPTHICALTHWQSVVMADASQRAEAFLKTLGKWVEE